MRRTVEINMWLGIDMGKCGLMLGTSKQGVDDMEKVFEVRPYGANDRRGYLQTASQASAINMHRIFGGAIIYLPTGWDITPKP